MAGNHPTVLTTVLYCLGRAPIRIIMYTSTLGVVDKIIITHHHSMWDVNKLKNHMQLVYAIETSSACIMALLTRVCVTWSK